MIKKLNRFSKDMSVTEDNRDSLPRALNVMVECFLAFIFLTIQMWSPYFANGRKPYILLALIPIIFLYIIVQVRGPYWFSMKKFILYNFF